ncbi:hypothetical protein [Arthrobacter antioxidans]|uniref:hypothetical protein n=1 Tax=Arthrobacter antioxidans TaxID=2895818 RepID=UPI001FFE2D9D|nr:hypothetical protein [Arthrobacter antioxidans]
MIRDAAVSSRPRRVAIVEPNSTGHRLYYVRLLVEEAARRGDEVFVLLAADAPASDEYEHHLGAIDGPFAVRSLPEGTTAMTLGHLHHLARELGTDLVVVPDGDRVARAMALSPQWRGPGRLSVLVLREKAQSNGFFGRAYLVNVLKSLIHCRADRGRHATVVLLKTSLWNGRSVLTTANDPVTMLATKSSIRRFKEEMGLDAARHWFAVLGVVDERKNLPLVARSLAALEGQRIGLLVAGRCSAAALASARPFLDSLRSAGVRVVVLDRMLSDLDLDSAVGAVDTVVMAHSNDGSSGLFGKAAAAGTRIVAAGSRTLRKDIADFPELGEWSRLDEEDLGAALARSLSDDSVRRTRSPGAASFTSPLLDDQEGRI